MMLVLRMLHLQKGMKIQETQILARRARTIEQEEHFDSEQDESDKQTSSKLSKLEELADVAMDSVKASNKFPATERQLFKAKQQVA